MFSSSKILSWLISLVLVAEVFCNVTKDTVVSTTIGTFIGYTEDVSFNGESKHIQRFLGIPYAKPPVGERRFSRPERFGTLTQPYNATYHRPHCLQTIPPYYIHLEKFEKSEDCLYLNVYVPGNVTSSKGKSAVMIYIHGGSYALGGADIYSGDVLAAFNDVIIVTINYRLNVFGFLSNGTKSSGNFGLWDMKMAIQWVHDHIDAFGGDRKRVTLFGNSAGGSAVMLQAMYPKNKGLFQRVIAQSGSSLTFWTIQKDPSTKFGQYIKDIGCDHNDYEDIRNCLLNKPAKDLQVDSWGFVPSIDMEFLMEEPAKTFSGKSLYGDHVRKYFAEIDLMAGVTSSDGAGNIPIWTERLEEENIDIHTGVPRSYFEDVFIPGRLTRIFGEVSAAMKQALIQQYVDWSRPDDGVMIREKMIDLTSDSSYFVPAVTASKKHSILQGSAPKSKSYFYVFDHKPGFIPEPKWLKGATHTMEVAYVFGLHKALERKLIDDLNAVDPLTVTGEDIKLSKVLMIMWSNFAKSGNPNAPVDQGTVNWPMFDHGTQKYLELSTHMTSLSVKHHFVASRVALWNDLVPVLSECNPSQLTSDASVVVAVSHTVLFFIFVLYVCLL